METFDSVRWNKERYARDQEALQKALDTMDGTLADKIRALHRQQTSIGFIRDLLKDVYRARLVEDPRNPNSRAFMIQYNPAREMRRQGAGRSLPPTGYESVNGGCFLCAQNIEWQQCGLEMGYKFPIGKRNYIAWCNPFPFMPNHVTIAAEEHKPQTWLYGNTEMEAGERLGRIIEDLLLIADQMPNFIILYNGDNAGASNKKHRHYHGFERVEGSESFAIEKHAYLELDRRIQPPFPLNHYPMTSIFFHGDVQSIVDDAVGFYESWEASCGSSVNISANIIGTKTQRKEKGTESALDLHFVPRNQQFSVSVGRSEVVGGLEVMGEIALSKPEEFARVTNGTMKYEDVVMMLKSVEAPEATSLIQAMQLSLHRDRRMTGRRSTDR